MQPTTKQPLFDLGQLVATPGGLTALEKAGQNAMEFLSRHVTGDWGDIPEEDRKENQYSLEHGFRLLSSYRTNADQIDPQDEALLPAAGSCARCPKRTGNNPLLFPEVRQKSI